jgi:hypothetical protein
MRNAKTICYLAALTVAAACGSEAHDPVLDELASLAPPAPQPEADGKSDGDVYFCPGSWEDGLSDVSGLAGYYQSSFLTPRDGLLALNLVSTLFDAESIGAQGSFIATMREGGVIGVETGRYLAAPNNPAIGAVIALQHGDRNATYHWVSGSRRTLSGKISALCLIEAVEAEDGSGARALAVPFTRLGL